jgi:hypothetical protein
LPFRFVGSQPTACVPTLKQRRDGPGPPDVDGVNVAVNFAVSLYCQSASAPRASVPDAWPTLLPITVTVPSPRFDTYFFPAAMVTNDGWLPVAIVSTIVSDARR